VPMAWLIQQVSSAFLPNPPDRIAVAVSGGGDSMALLHLMHGFCRLHGSRLFAVTVDHCLRPEGAEEAEAVGAYCATLGVPHDTLIWDDWDGIGNLQAEARDARYECVSDWAKERGIRTVALGHTADDQAETVLMRLARRAGVDGLSSISPRMSRHGIHWVRPLLSVTREGLRSYLRSQQVSWVEDPSNDDTTFERIRARKALAELGKLGIDASGLATVAEQMRQARVALNWQTFLAARDIARVEKGAVVLDERRLRIQPEEIQRRLLVHALGWISGNPYPPRRAAVATLMAALRRGLASTLDGCHALREKESIWVFREHKAVQNLRVPAGLLWDSRWRIKPATDEAARQRHYVAVMGPQGVEQCGDWRASGLPLQAVMSLPAVWQDDVLLAAPLVRPDQNWHAALEGGEETFFGGLLSH
jgi:tRNA(Ile)-lysidine synthetase, N-terminal domain